MKKLVRSLLLGVGAFVAISCQNSNENTASKLKVGMVTFPGYAPLYLAQEKALFKNVEVELMRIENISDLRAAMSSGKIDIYLATYDIFQSVGAVAPPGVAFMALDESHGADGIAADPAIRTANDLKGKQVAAEPGFPPYFILQYFLHEAGLTLKDVGFKDMASQDAGSAFAAGHFAAVGTYEPYLSKAIRDKSGAHLLSSSRQLPGVVVDFAFASEEAMRSKQPALQAFAEGWFVALKHIEVNEKDDMAIMGKAFSVPGDEMKDFHSGVSWINLERNKQLFDSTSADNVYIMFDKVGAILDANGARGVKMVAKERMNGTIISAMK